jgi:uncharacterized protein involved in exopolysaccharide biosynthesis
LISVEQNNNSAPVETSRIRIPITDLAAAVWQRRVWLAILTGIGVLCSVAIALLIPPQFTSTAQLMPVSSESLRSTSALDMFSGVGTMLRGSSLMNEVTPGATAIGILSSRTELDDIINKLDLKSVYHCKVQADARMKLLGHSRFTEDKNSGIITIAIVDGDRYRAQKIAQAYVVGLDKLVATLNSSSAHRERVFLDDRLHSLKSDLDATALRLSQFSSRNGTLNPQSQGQALIVSATQLQNQLIAARSDLQELKARYTDDNVRVRQVRARIDELQRQIQKMGSTRPDVGGTAIDPGQLYPSMRQLPLLGATYLELSRQLAIEESVYETLTKQFELAKVQEAKELPTVNVLDQPDLAERRTSPRRTIIVILGSIFSFFAGVAWLTVSRLWQITDDSRSGKAIVLAILKTIRSGPAAESK